MKKSWLAALLFIGCLTVLYPLCAHAGRQMVVTGKVTDTRNRPVPMALVSIPLLNVSTLSDDNGRYRLVITKGIHSGQEVVIRASREGFDYVSRPIVLAPGAKKRAIFRLTPVR